MIITTRPYNSPSTMKRGSFDRRRRVSCRRNSVPRSAIRAASKTRSRSAKVLRLFIFVPFKILVVVRRYPKPINRRHSIERVVVADEAVEAGDPVVERPGRGAVLFRRP